MDDDLKQNPFPVYGGWRWRDENGTPHHKVYPTQLDALYAMLKYIKYLNNGPTLLQRMWWPVRYGLWPMLVRVWRT